MAAILHHSFSGLCAKPKIRTKAYGISVNKNMMSKSSCRKITAELQENTVQSSLNGQLSTLAEVPSHLVTVHDTQRGIVHKFWVPEMHLKEVACFKYCTYIFDQICALLQVCLFHLQDQYILHTAEDQDIELPFACRHGCCTTCAVRVKSGVLRQPEALGISSELKDKGYALLCVGFPSSDLEVETQNEDEVYWLQFGRYFARGPIDRDDYALELAMGDE